MKQFLILLIVVFTSVNASAQTKKIQPFTGAMIIENGIRYDELEIKVNGELLLTPSIPQDEELVIRITKPWSFIADSFGKVHPGVGFRIADKTGKIIATVDDIYKNNKKGFSPYELSALSISITLDKNIKLNDSITIYTKFFDTKNGDSLLITLPCKVVAKGTAQILKTWNYFSSTSGLEGRFVNCKAQDFSIKKTYSKKETPTTVDTLNLSIKTLTDFVLKNDKAYLNATYTLYDKNFNIVETKPLFANADNGLTTTQLENIKQQFVLPAGFADGIARILIEDKNGKGKLDAVFNFIY